MIKRPIMIACAGFLVVLVALLLLFLSDEEVVDKNMAGSTTEKDNEAESSQQDLIIKNMKFIMGLKFLILQLYLQLNYLKDISMIVFFQIKLLI